MVQSCHRPLTLTHIASLQHACHSQGASPGARLWTRLHDSLGFHWFVFSWALSVPGSHPRHHIMSSHHASIASSGLWEFLRLPLFLRPQQFWGVLVGYLVEGPSMCVCLGSVSWLRLGLGNWGGRPQRQSATVLTSYRGRRLTTRLTTVDVDLDCMAGFMSAAFLCCQDTFPVSPPCSSEGSSSEGVGSSAPTHLRGSS